MPYSLKIMPRRKRYTQSHSCHHVMLRGNAGRSIFFDNQDRIRFCLILQKAAEEHHLMIHAFCFMSNHVHFILEPTTSSLSIGVHAFAGRYAQYFNRRYKQRGHLFQGRFRSILIEDHDYLIRLVRYIHLNPVRAKLTTVPQNYFWSSYRTYIDLDELTWLTQTRILEKFGKTIHEARQAMIHHGSKAIESELDVNIIRESGLTGILGSDDFAKKIVKHKSPSGNREIQFVDLITAAQTEFQYKSCEINSKSREKRLVDIRSILALAVQKTPGLYLQELAKYLNRDSSTLSRLVNRASQSRNLSIQTDKLLETVSLFLKAKS